MPGNQHFVWMSEDLTKHNPCANQKDASLTYFLCPGCSSSRQSDILYQSHTCLPASTISHLSPHNLRRRSIPSVSTQSTCEGEDKDDRSHVCLLLSRCHHGSSDHTDRSHVCLCYHVIIMVLQITQTTQYCVILSVPVWRFSAENNRAQSSHWPTP